MLIYDRINKVPKMHHNSIITIGKYDGIHLGHQSIIKLLTDKAKFYNTTSGVLTFFPHPTKVLYPHRYVSERIFDLEDQQQELNKRGINFLIIEPFNQKLASVSPEIFIKDYLVKFIRPKMIIVGYNFTFGASKKGNIGLLNNLCKRYNIDCVIMPPVKKHDVIVSSSNIKKFLEAGKIFIVNSLLGRNFYLKGKVTKGIGFASKLGIPTINFNLNPQYFLKKGVYITKCKINDETFSSITNVGFAPTIRNTNKNTNKNIKVETHILKFSKEVYDKEVKIEFLQYLREEIKFENYKFLKNQINKDIEICKRFFDEQNKMA